MTPEVAAIHSRNVAVQRCQGLSVIPVVKMPVMPLQPLHGLHGAVSPFDKFDRTYVAEILRGDISEQCQTHIGWGCAMGNCRGGDFLKIIRRQPVIVRPHKGFEEKPGTACRLPQECCLFDRQFSEGWRMGPAYPPGDGRSRGPQ